MIILDFLEDQGGWINVFVMMSTWLDVWTSECEVVVVGYSIVMRIL